MLLYPIDNTIEVFRQQENGSLQRSSRFLFMTLAYVIGGVGIDVAGFAQQDDLFKYFLKLYLMMNCSTLLAV